MERGRKWIPLIVGLLLTPPCLLVAILSGGIGHGSYTPAMLLFPYAAIFIIFFDNFPASTLIMACLAVLQLPAYGYLLSVYAAKGKIRASLSVILVLHVLVVVVALLA